MENEKFEDNEFYSDEDAEKLNLPKKSKYRQRAHCNPLAEISIAYPVSPSCVDWSLHYPLFYEKSQKENSQIVINTIKHPTSYEFNNKYESSNEIPEDLKLFSKVNILDVGCGYGGLMFNMSPYLPEDNLVLGMEIRDKVSNFVGDKIRSLRINANHTQYNNISVIRTNSMKLILNYFYKEQLDKIFFCFPDPHFKKYNHRKRIINKYLLNDYAYILKYGGKLYTITDVEDLYKWETKTLDDHPCFKRLSEDEIGEDQFIEYMKNTDEAKKVKKNKGDMYYAVYERVHPQINSISELYNFITTNE